MSNSFVHKYFNSKIEKFRVGVIEFVSEKDCILMDFGNIIYYVAIHTYIFNERNRIFRQST